MNNICIEYKDIRLKQNYIELIKFLSTMSNKITYSVIMEYYLLSPEEYLDSVKDIADEYSKEDLSRRLRYMNDLEYRETLFKTYHTYEEIFAYLDRLKYYDLVELEQVKKQLQHYVNDHNYDKKKKEYLTLESKKLKHEVPLPKESYIRNKFTYNSHCIIGGLYKVYYFKMDEMMIEYLYNKGDLIKFNSFNEIYFLEDPCFYKGDRVICSICSHEQTFALFLEDNELEDFRLLKIPFSY